MSAALLLLLAACGTSGVPALGDGVHSLRGVSLTEIATADDGLNLPRDLAFHPHRPAELWVVNMADDTTVTLFDVGGSAQEAWKSGGWGSHHFLPRPSALAFGENGHFATTHEIDEPTQGPNGTPGDFMGPSLWPSDLEIYDGGHAGHIDMLHNSPNAMGVAWEIDNAYWVFDGYHTSLTRYDFVEPHEPGGSDHSDGIVRRYVEGEVGYEPGVPSHLVYDPTDALLYVADTANHRIAVLDTTSGELGGNIHPNYDGSDQRHVHGASLDTFLEGTVGDEIELVLPSGLALVDDILYVSDNATSLLLAFDLEGTLLDWLDTELPAGSLMGITLGDDGRLYLVDAEGDRILRVDVD